MVTLVRPEAELRLRNGGSLTLERGANGCLWLVANTCRTEPFELRLLVQPDERKVLRELLWALRFRGVTLPRWVMPFVEGGSVTGRRELALVQLVVADLADAAAVRLDLWPNELASLCAALATRARRHADAAQHHAPA